MVGYKTSLFKIFTPKWLLIRPYGDFVSGLITSPSCSHPPCKNISELLDFEGQKRARAKKFLRPRILRVIEFLRIKNFSG